MTPEHYAYTPINVIEPPQNEPVLTKIHDEKGERNEQVLILQGRLWWFEDKSMYVYYTPTHWARLK